MTPLRFSHNGSPSYCRNFVLTYLRLGLPLTNDEVSASIRYAWLYRGRRDKGSGRGKREVLNGNNVHPPEPAARAFSVR